MIKRYRIPVLMGAVTALIGFLITYADLTIYFGVTDKTGLPLGYDGREIFITLSAAIGGPLAAVVAILQFPFIGMYLSLPASGVAVIMLDRLTASLAVVFLYKFMHKHIKNIPLFLFLWAVAIWAYYTIAFNIEEIAGCIISGTSIIETYQALGVRAITATLFEREPPVTYVFTVLALLSIPLRFRKPLWMQTREPVDEKNPLLSEAASEKTV